MTIYPLLRLIKLDLSLLISIGMKVVKIAGVPRSIPLIITGIILAVITATSTLSRIIFPRPPSKSCQPWMVKHQLNFALNKKVVQMSDKKEHCLFSKLDNLGRCVAICSHVKLVYEPSLRACMMVDCAGNKSEDVTEKFKRINEEKKLH